MTIIQKGIVKKTRQGKILKIIREHYLRDDIGCGSQLCRNKVCSSSFNPRLSLGDKIPSISRLLVDQPHYILPDTNIILHQVFDFFSKFSIKEFTSLNKTINCLM
jgi:exosome complex exonuclease DIS3/RRP44